MDVTSLVDQACGGGAHQARAVGRLISLVENGHALLPTVMGELARHTRAGIGAHVVGVTGSPGVGKSTTVSALLRALRSAGDRVGVLAVDPSSPFTGGALLGDRIRMEEHATDPGVFLRSVGSRGHLGGLSAATPQAVRVLDAAGFDRVVIETVGVGQSEVDIAARADTTVVILAPGMGDGIQAVKAGLLEIGDILVVNKADREGADITVRDLRHMIQLSQRETTVSWRRPIIKVVASRGDGIAELLESLDAHRGWLIESGELARRRRERVQAEVESLVLGELRREMGAYGTLVDTDLADAIVAGEISVYAAATQVLATVRS